MGYFPFFIDMDGKNGLVVGGGAVALRKVEKLLPYGPQLTVVAPSVLPELEQLPEIRVMKCPFEAPMLDGMLFVIAATDDSALNQEIAHLCRERGILVNVVDTLELCSFLFPALVKAGHLTAGISTGGVSPTAAVWLKEQIAALLPETMEEILDDLAIVRTELKATLPEEKRAKAYASLFNACIACGRSLTAEERAKVLEEL